MRVLGIDPGPKESAFCLWNGTQIIESGKIESDLMLTRAGSFSSNVPDIVAVEILQCFGMGVGREVFETAYWIGEFRQWCRYNEVNFFPVTRLQVKQHFCHTARATDSNIKFALEDRFGVKGTKKKPGLMYPLVGNDMRSAFAIAVMVYDQTNGVGN